MKPPGLFLVVLLFLVFTSFTCDREDDILIDDLGPRIEFLSPNPDTRVEPGASVWMHVRFSEELELHEMRIILRTEEEPNMGVLFAGHSHEKEHEVEKEVQLPNMPGTTFELYAEASDHEGNTSEATVRIQMD